MKIILSFHENNSLTEVDCMTIHYGILINYYCFIMLFTASKTI